MNAHKKSIRLAAVAFLATGAVTLAACSGGASGGDDDEPVELTWTTQSNVAPETIDAVVAEFEEEHPNVTVKVERLADDDLKNTVRTQLAAGTGPDLFTVWPGTEGLLAVQDIGNAGMLAPVDDIPWASEAEPGSVASATVNDHVYMVVPGYASTGAIYNSDSLAAANVAEPETWDELLDFCAEAEAEQKAAFGLGLQDGWTARLIPLAFLANLIPDVEAWNASLADGSFDFTTSEEWRTALEKMMEMNDAGCFNESPAGTSTGDVVLPGVINGDFLGLVSVSAHAGVMEGMSTDPLSFNITPLPSGAAEDNKFQITYANGVGVNANSKNLELAKELLAAFGDVANVNSFSSELGLLPSIINDDFEVPPALEMTAQYVADGRAAGGDWRPGDATVVASTNGIQGLFLGTTTIDQVLQDMQTAYEEYMSTQG